MNHTCWKTLTHHKWTLVQEVLGANPACSTAPTAHFCGPIPVWLNLVELVPQETLMTGTCMLLVCQSGVLAVARSSKSWPKYSSIHQPSCFTSSEMQVCNRDWIPIVAMHKAAQCAQMLTHHQSFVDFLQALLPAGVANSKLHLSRKLPQVHLWVAGLLINRYSCHCIDNKDQCTGYGTSVHQQPAGFPIVLLALHAEVQLSLQAVTFVLAKNYMAVVVRLVVHGRYPALQ